MRLNIGNIPSHAQARFGEKTALVCQERTFSFKELDQLSNRLASGLRLLGILRGDRVSLYSSNSWEWVVSYYGILKLGAVVNPINVMLTSGEVAYVTNDCGAKTIISSSDKGALLVALRGKTLVENIILFGDAQLDGALRFKDVIASGDDNFAPAHVDPDSLSTICYTSGTTGYPKGAGLSHRNVLTSTAMTALMHTRTELDTVVSALPCSHVYGNVVMNAALWYGMTLVLIRKFSEHAVLEAIQQNRATMFEGVPTMYMYLLAYPERHKYDVSSLRKCTVGGQTMPIATMQSVEAEFGCPLIELWGMTEVAGPATTHPFYGENRHGSIGVPLPGVECRIASVDNGAITLPPGEIGELMVRGPLVMHGYHGKEEETRKAIDPDGWLHTGDLARMDPDGYFYLVDRKNDMIITGGFNVYPAELERVVAAHPAVALVAVGSQPDDLKGEVAKAYVVRKLEAKVTEEEIIAFCRENIAAYKVPRAVQFVDDLPTTSTGKIMRRALRSLDNPS
ncbi:long-chain-fatty-acid--CoA ligase [Paraburkholderia sp.]|uniref:long-chain-fatty-acid--CoA ligase n=1 Tax=Paraburkholderia sp. TaxID=1926495 RepID=UPI003C7EA2A6